MNGQYAIGLMSGTSIDGIDGALVKLFDNRFELVHFVSQSYLPQERQAILRLCDPETATVEDICYWNFELGKKFANVVRTVADQAGVPLREISFVGSHGQTIWHIPGHSTLQIGEPAVIANLTGLVTVADFRPADIAVGGQGAPLIPYVDQLLFGDLGTVAVQNIGGIGNVTVVGPESYKLPAIAFDTGPGNMIIDGVVEEVSRGEATFDRDGKLASAGNVDHSLLTELLSHPYFTADPPKSTGREVFGKDFARKLAARGLPANDLVATVTAFTAQSIKDQYERFIFPYCRLEQVIIGGGGSFNPTLLQMLRNLLQVPVRTHEAFGIPSDAKEALGFALLAQATLKGETNNVPRATGATSPAILGKVCYPYNNR